MEPKATLYQSEVKTPEAQDGTWVGIGIESFKVLYPRGRDYMVLDESGVPMGAWLATII
jgi:hypothetical protein